MRFFYFLVLVVFVAAVAIFAYQNQENITINYLNRNASIPFALLVAGAYVLGMLSGWTVVGMLKRSWQRVTEVPDRRYG